MNDPSERRRGDSAAAADSGASGPPVILILGILVALFTVIFVFSNGEDVPVDFLGWTIATPPSWVLIVISLVLGAVLSRLFGWFSRRRRHRD